MNVWYSIIRSTIGKCPPNSGRKVVHVSKVFQVPVNLANCIQYKFRIKIWSICEWKQEKNLIQNMFVSNQPSENPRHIFTFISDVNLLIYLNWTLSYMTNGRFLILCVPNQNSLHLSFISSLISITFFFTIYISNTWKLWNFDIGKTN